MRHELAAAWLAALVACGSPPPAPDETAIPEQRVLLTGVVLDSLAGLPVAGARVLGTDSVEVTDAAGSFRLMVPARPFTVLVTHPGYEGYALSVALQMPAHRIVRLRRLAPAVLGCRIAADTVYATVVDLQGRKTVNRREGSVAILRSGGQDVMLSGLSWYWQPVDSLTLAVFIPPPGGRVTGATLTVSDVAGFRGTAECFWAGLPVI
jgi:hypothetical protein